MEKIINVGGQEVKMLATASTVMRYKLKFGRDLLKDFSQVNKAQTQKDNSEDFAMSGEDLEIFLYLSYTMAKQANPDISDNPWDWLDTFEVFPMDEVFPQVAMLWMQSQGVNVESKKKVEPPTEK